MPKLKRLCSFAIICTPFLFSLNSHAFSNNHSQLKPKTQYTLGMRYLKGEKVKQDFNQAKQWFEKAASQGYELAKLELDKLTVQVGK